MRRASSRFSKCTADRQPGFILEVDRGERLPVDVAGNEALPVKLWSGSSTDHGEGTRVGSGLSIIREEEAPAVLG